MTTRRAFLGTAAAAPMVAPQIASEAMASGRLGMPMGYRQEFDMAAMQAAQQAEVANRLTLMQSALAEIDDLPDDVIAHNTPGMFNFAPDLAALKSCSDAGKAMIQKRRHIAVARERMRMNLQERIDDALGKPMSKWRELMRML